MIALIDAATGQYVGPGPADNEVGPDWQPPPGYADPPVVAVHGAPEHITEGWGWLSGWGWELWDATETPGIYRPPTDAVRLARVKDALRESALADLLEERHRRVDLYTGADARARDNRLMAAVGIIDRVQSGTATPEDRELMEALRQVEPLVRGHDAAAAAIRAEILAAESPAALDAIMAALATDARWPT
jgi:hypothetical protein